MTPAILCPFEITMSVFIHRFSTTDLKVPHKGKYYYYHFTDEKSGHREVNCHWTILHLLFYQEIIHLWYRPNFSLSFLDCCLFPVLPNRIQKLMQRFKFMWSYWHCVLFFVSLWFLEILLFLPALERAEIISFSMSTDYKTRSGSCIFQTLKEPDCGNPVKTVCKIQDNYNIHYFRVRFPVQHCTWFNRVKSWCLLESCWPISAQQCLWCCLKIQRNCILDSSLCLTFFTQHHLWRGEKMNLCLWMINCLKIGLIMAALTDFHL